MKPSKSNNAMMPYALFNALATLYKAVQKTSVATIISTADSTTVF
ncbi:hypothetical protein DSUL_140027 [Desulfovibrionales bacterium]